MSKSSMVFFSIVLSCLALAGPAEKNETHRSLDATLWVQCATEWQALCHQAYNLAGNEISDRLKDPSWTAALEQSADLNRAEKPPAIIVDIDETVLDNSPYQARLVLDGQSYSASTWKQWVDQGEASPIPGALRFLIETSRLGIEIYYVTNRTSDLEAPTRQNLKKFGFPLNHEVDTVLMKGEKSNWTSDKTSRRQAIAKTHRILMLVGDDFGDFCGAARVDHRTRKEAADSHASFWGRGWFMLPNPNYGSWQKSVVGFHTGLTPETKSKMELNALDPRRK